MRTLLIKCNNNNFTVRGDSDSISHLARWIAEYLNYKKYDENIYLLYEEKEFRGCKIKARHLCCDILD